MQVVHTAAHRLHDPQVELENSTVNDPLEHPGRVEAIHDALASDARFTVVASREHGTAPIEAVHDPGLVRFLAEAWQLYQERHGPTREVVPDVFYRPALRRGMPAIGEPEAISGRLGWWCFETTTPLTEGTYAAACGSVDVALTATDAVLGGELAAYGLCRPPGHHAGSALYGGYCFFNNAAIAAEHAVRTAGARVTVLDVDYHHGNGTQEIFYDRGDVQYVSLHGDPRRAYPYTVGYADETGAGLGAGATLNVPLDAGVDDAGYLAALDSTFDAIDRFGADLLVVSLGVDTYADDPICDLALSTAGYWHCGATVAELGRRTVVLQEGGYFVPALGENVRQWLLGLAGSSATIM
jgi:acetoin utilization deacetylase AcuC-like enzyme